jgi:hypothetical protein
MVLQCELSVAKAWLLGLRPRLLPYVVVPDELSRHVTLVRIIFL